MAVELQYLYHEIRPEYEVKLHTKSCFDRKISWVHMVEGSEHAKFLYGDELVFNSGLNYNSEEWLEEFLRAMDRAGAGGVILALEEGKVFPQKVIDWCNERRFPLFSASGNTPYIDIMRKFSEILLKNEQRETNLIAALKNAIFYPDNEELYLNHLERNGFSRDSSYTVIIISCHTCDTEKGNELLEAIQRTLHFRLKRTIVYEEEGRLIVLAAGYRGEWLQKEFYELCREDPNLYIGAGTTVNRLKDIHRSYENAYTAYQLTKTTIPKNFLVYDELGIYKILTDIKDPGIYPDFVEEVLGKLVAYDKEQGTDYMKIQRAYFENDCSTICTAKALYCHKNTLTYKLNTIKEVLGYDILNNENRVRIMVAFYILQLGTGDF